MVTFYLLELRRWNVFNILPLQYHMFIRLRIVAFQNSDASSVRSASATGPETQTDELGGRSPGAVSLEGQFPNLGAGARELRRRYPELDALRSAGRQGGPPTSLDPKEPVLGTISEIEPGGKKALALGCAGGATSFHCSAPSQAKQR